MENRLKERLTGAAILVALIVALVPEMFRGQRDEVGSTAGNSADGPPVRSYTIDLSNDSKSSAPLQSVTDEARQSVPPAASSAAPSAAPAPPPTAATPTPAPAPVQQASIAGAESAKPEASKTAVGRPELSKPPISAAASPTHSIRAATASSSPSASRQAPAGSWSVQIGLFAKRDNAERMAHDAQAKGFSVSVSNPDASGLFHVRAVGLQDRAAAQALSQRMQSQGIKSAVVPP